MLKKNSANKINSILGPEVDVDGDVKVVGSILIYGKVNGNVTVSGTGEQRKVHTLKEILSLKIVL